MVLGTAGNPAVVTTVLANAPKLCTNRKMQSMHSLALIPLRDKGLPTLELILAVCTMTARLRPYGANAVYGFLICAERDYNHSQIEWLPNLNTSYGEQQMRVGNKIDKHY